MGSRLVRNPAMHGVKYLTEMRLQRLMAQRGLGSRRHCEQVILAGRVRVNGEVATLGTVVGPADEITVDAKQLPAEIRHYYLMLNKPAGVVTTRRDPGGRPTVMQYLPPGLESVVFPVGRLDLPSEGLLLLTNDGDLANRLLHPRYEVAKTYLAWVAGHPSPASLEPIRQGIEIEPGIVARGEASVRETWSGGALLQIVVREGKKREVRRICEAVGLRVARLKRVAFGPLLLGNLAEGTARQLSATEVSALRVAAGLVRTRDS
jgi:23S rRNA pseudouridine2605 synthase